MSIQNKRFKVNNHHELKALTKRLFNSYVEGLEEIDYRWESRTISKWSQSLNMKRFKEPDSTSVQLEKEQDTSHIQSPSLYLRVINLEVIANKCL
jgi:hypothetical protein